MTIHFENYKPEFAQDFYELNVEWLKTHFFVEPYDEEVLSKPETYILDKGGFIIFALMEDHVVGTVALMPTSGQGVYELSKMAVSPKFRGFKIGQKLMGYCIDFAKAKKMKTLILYSNTKLENAIYIYRKFGFTELPLETNSPYLRGNIKMKLDIS